MTAIDADKFLAYLIFSKYIDGLTCGEVKEAIEMCKINVPEPKTEWTPVSEGLPKSKGMYIVTRKIYDCPDTAQIVMTDGIWFGRQNTWHYDNRINHERGCLSDVVAWTLLPEPYKPQESEDKE